MLKKRGKKGQQILGMSFSVIFSILLIVFFILIAFIVINSFLKTKKCAQIGMFADDFQTKVTQTWNSQKDDLTETFRLPSSLDYVCFMNLTSPINAKNQEMDQIGFDLDIYEGRRPAPNMFLYSDKKACEMPYHTIKHLDLEKITALENPYCIRIDDGVISIDLKKGFNDRLVSVSR